MEKNMRREIVIGTDLPSNFNSICLWSFADISENDNFYKLDNGINDTTIYVYKKSTQGEELKQWIENKENQNNASVNRKAIELLLPYLTVDEFYEILDMKVRKAWDEGYSKAQYDIRKALGIR